jgi:hypothetical protein
MAYATAAAAASAAFAFSGRHDTRNPDVRERASHPRGDDGSGAAATVPGDVAAAIRTALDRMAPLMRRTLVHMDIAVAPGLVVPVPGAALRSLIEEMVTAAAHAAPVSRLLLTAVPQGNGIEIALADDLPNADQAYRLVQVRGLQERAARYGGALHVTVQPSHGTTLLLRLPAGSESSVQDSAARPAQEPHPSIPLAGSSR